MNNLTYFSVTYIRIKRSYPWSAYSLHWLKRNPKHTTTGFSELSTRDHRYPAFMYKMYKEICLQHPGPQIIYSIESHSCYPTELTSSLLDQFSEIVLAPVSIHMFQFFVIFLMRCINFLWVLTKREKSKEVSWFNPTLNCAPHCHSLPTLLQWDEGKYKRGVAKNHGLR